MANIFAYGTLMFKEFHQKLTSKAFPVKKATLNGYQRYRVKDKIYPGVIRGEGKVEGSLLMDVDDESLKLFDFYEGNEYVRKTETVISDGKEYEAFVYVWKNTEKLNGEWTKEDIKPELVHNFIHKIRNEFKNKSYK